MVYLDHNATTPLDPEVLDVMMPFLRERFGNPSSRHHAGRAARAAIERARDEVAALVNARPDEVVFTSGGTEANNLALKGMAAMLPAGAIAVGATEHASVLAAAQAVRGRPLQAVAVDRDGRVDSASLDAALAAPARLVSIMTANNETGVLQDIPALAARVRAAGAVLHTDAVQAAGRVALDFAAGGAQLMTLSAHKIFGPKGAGALVIDRRLDIEPLLHGGGHEGGRRAGTENVAAIVGFGAAAVRAARDLEARQRHCLALRERLEARLAALPGIEIHGAGAHRIANTTFLSVAGIDGATLLLLLDQAGFALSSGSACGSDRDQPSHVLAAMGVGREQAIGALRVSVGPGNTREEIDALVDTLAGVINGLQQRVGRAPAPA